jgi:hypothetical protein
MIIHKIECPEVHILNLPLEKGYRLLSVNQGIKISENNLAKSF